MRRILFLFAIICLSACKNSGLGSGYFYLTSEEASDVGYPYGSIIYQAGKEYVFNKVCVFAQVTKVMSLNKVVLIKQNVDSALLYKLVSDDITFWNQHFKKTGKDSLVNIAGEKHSIQSLPKNIQSDVAAKDFITNNPKLSLILNNKVNYYILDLRSNILSDPFSLNEFRSECKRLGIEEVFE